MPDPVSQDMTKMHLMLGIRTYPTIVMVHVRLPLFILNSYNNHWQTETCMTLHVSLCVTEMCCILHWVYVPIHNSHGS